MSIALKTVGIVVKDMSATLAFYRVLGFPIPAGHEQDDNLDVTIPGGIVLGFLTEELAKQADPRFTPPSGSSLNLQFLCDSPTEVDAIFSKLTAAGYGSYTEPWDAFWGQRFARITDPDGRIVNLYADL